MSQINHTHNDNLADLMKHGLLHPSNPDFDHIIMQKVVLASQRKIDTRKNLRLSWVFLVLSLILFPASYFVMFDTLKLTHLRLLNIQLRDFADALYLAGIILFSVIILIQIDNLVRLTFRKKIA